MEFRQLQSFVEIVKENSFTKAAENLFLSQSTLSVHVKQIEEELKTSLILRTTKSIELTPKGQDFYNYAVSILELRDKMLEECSVNNQQIIHIGASTIPAAYILPEVLPDFGTRNPEIYFVIQQSDSQGIIDKVKENVLDIGIVGMKTEDVSLEFLPFCEDGMVMITPVNEKYLSMEKNLESVREILVNDPVILREKGSGTRKRSDYILENLGISEENLKVVARVNDQEIIQNLVAGGVGVSIISERAADNFIHGKRLIAFSLPKADFSRKLYIVFRKNYVIKQNVKRFMDYMVERYRRSGE